MIKINFIEDEIREQRHALIRRYAMIAYGLICAVAFVVSALQYEQNLTITRQHEARLAKLQSEIDASYPHFRKAINLYQDSKKARRNLEGLYEHAFEPRFALAALTRLAASTPEKVWLSSVELGPLASQKPDGAGRTMLIRGNLLFEATDKKDGRLDSFRSVIQAHPPFSHANIVVNLDGMQVAKYESSYYHTFELLLRWPRSIL